MKDPIGEILAAIIALCTDTEGLSKITYDGRYWEVVEDIMDVSGNNNYVLLRDIRLEENNTKDKYIHEVILDVDVIELVVNHKPGYTNLETACNLFTETVIDQDLTMTNFSTVVAPYMITATRFAKTQREDKKIELKKSYELRFMVQQKTAR